MFYAGALGATLAVGVVASFFIGDIAASDNSSPMTWVAIVDIAIAALLLAWVVRAVHRPVDPKKMAGMVAQMSKVATSPAIAVVGAGAVLANPGGFIPIALKDISETDPSTAEYVVNWVFFSLVSLLPLALAIVMLFIAPDRTKRTLVGIRDWLVRNAMKVAAAIVALLALSLLRNGIAGLVS
jgi:Sap, sulfolipid-1-addressing protein